MPDAGVVAIVAGGGRFPAEVAEAARAAGRQVAVIALRGFADKDVAGKPHAVVDMLDPAGLLELLSGIKPDCVVLAGAVTRPGPLALASVFSAFRNRDELARIFAKGDDRLLRGAVGLIEDAGFRVVGAQEIAPGILAPEGAIGAVAPRPEHQRDIVTGTELLAVTGPFDIGQAVVVCGGRVLAVEGPEGTDAMLERVAGLQRSKRVRLDGQGGVLVKRPKSGQDLRVDLPAIGPRTVERARAAGLAGIAVQAGGVVLVDRAELLRAADRVGLFVVGTGA
ncbi:hypothetical protein GCM10007036_26400 [Alsobacter metallidurans]|uniref:UDP-2,3-diacylglucosamine pyrophosphatase LpxI n=1 Tax=Alsobacter metallidurans TaxID=340221 RepID=A0A917I899_9HYPH|nr:UDP-2,3-diacylglucosamine diphosphatase LpxI [Alsobacter metallidurans]GGH21824.1 hypothetical protein GCM10007036_26400 [Alsobacter metallidurans]